MIAVPPPPAGAAGGAPVDSIVELTRALVRIPTRAGVDPCGPLFAVLEEWLRSHGVAVDRLRSGAGETVAILAGTGERPPRWYVLDATVDTAPFGDEAAWTRDPTGAEIDGGWMYGRGTADCKVAVAVFAHLLADAARTAPGIPAVGLFDADEHTGRFGGLCTYLDDADRRAGTAGVLIGYPGNDRIVVGSRGFLRAVIHVAGESAHSGSQRPAVANAVRRAAWLVTELDGVVPPGTAAVDAGFPVPPKLTVTAVRGGEDFSIVPDRCTVSVDVRLTPRFGPHEAEAHLREAARRLDAQHAAPRPTAVEVVMARPAYRLPDASPLPAALRSGAEEAFGRRPPFEVVGPSNVGNVLAELGIEATAGFGVTHRNLHAVDEAIDVSTIDPVYRSYRSAVEVLGSTGTR